MRITAADLVREIQNLPRNRVYHYPNLKTKTVLEINHIELPEGPIVIKRYNPYEQNGRDNAKEESISSQMLWRVANAFVPNQPLNIDRILGASYNTRSALEALLAHTPLFYMSYPGRIEVISSSTKIQKGHKHLMWTPNEPHELGEVHTKETEAVISEIPNREIIYDALTVPENGEEMDIDMQRRHAQIQIALIMIGRHLEYKTWIARNDMAIRYQDKRLGEMEGVLPTLSENTIISPFSEAVEAMLLIDCVWFKNGRLMPAVMEIEHSTGVISGLNRMKKLQNVIPAIQTRYVIVAPDEDRNKVVSDINLQHFAGLNARYFPYSAVEELWSLCEHRKIKGVTDEFLDCYMEKVSTAN